MKEKRVFCGTGEPHDIPFRPPSQVSILCVRRRPGGSGRAPFPTPFRPLCRPGGAPFLAGFLQTHLDRLRRGGVLLQRHPLPAETGISFSGSSERSDQLRHPHAGAGDLRSHLLRDHRSRMSAGHHRSRGAAACLCTRIPAETGSSSCPAVDGGRRGRAPDPQNVPGTAIRIRRGSCWRT